MALLFFFFHRRAAPTWMMRRVQQCAHGSSKRRIGINQSMGSLNGDALRWSREDMQHTVSRNYTWSPQQARDGGVEEEVSSFSIKPHKQKDSPLLCHCARVQMHSFIHSSFINRRSFFPIFNSPSQEPSEHCLSNQVAIHQPAAAAVALWYYCARSSFVSLCTSCAVR